MVAYTFAPKKQMAGRCERSVRYVGIDPSTKTGLVILDLDGNLIDAVEVGKHIEKIIQRLREKQR